MRTLILFLLLMTTALGQEPPKAVIRGPSQVLAGTLLFLSHEAATGDNKVWIIPPDLVDASASCGGNIFFAIPKPGTYQFGLIVADKQARIDYTYHTVRVVSSPGETGPDDPGPVNPTPTKPSFGEVVAASKEGLAKLNDSPTALSIKKSLESVVADSANKTLEQLIVETKKVITVSLAIRRGDSWKKDWGLLWVYPVDLEIAKLKIQDSATYVQLLQALANSL